MFNPEFILIRNVLSTLLLGIILTGTSFSSDYVAIEEHLGLNIPGDLNFTTEDGESVILLDIIDKPTLIAPVYYNCPGLCTPIMDGLVKLLNRTDLQIGKDFDVINFSFHQNESPELAGRKKKNYTSLLADKTDADHWRFMTGDSSNIQDFLETLGYSVIRKGEDILHPAAIMIASPTGKLVKYIYGTKFNPIEFKMAVKEASNEKTSSTITRMMKMCFNYEPSGRNKQKSVTILGFLIMICTGAVLVTIYPPLKNKN